MKNISILVWALILLSGCVANNSAKPISFNNQNVKIPIQPEDLLDLSSERVSFSITTKNAVNDINDWIDNDHPNRADLTCNQSEPTCNKIISILKSFSIPYRLMLEKSPNKELTLIYDRISVRDCSVMETENNIMNKNILGCSVASNMLQMISDQQQFVKPDYLGLHDASKAMMHYRKHYHTKTNQ
jgi:hypothetical protein